jgi:hypothetical protein
MFDTYGYDDNTGNAALNANNYAELAGLPNGFDTIVFASIATSLTAANHVQIPYNNFHTNNTTTSRIRYPGISTTFNKLTSLFTAPVGATATNELTVNAKFDGWAGYGGGGQDTTAPYVSQPTWHGGGQGASVNTSTTGTNRTLAGGNAAVNSGSGGGSAAAFTSTTTVLGAAGGTGGSGVILIGYWA